MKARIITLLAVTGFTLSAYHWMPESSLTRSSIDMKLPERLGMWKFERVQPTEVEIRGLAKDTEFSKAICLGPSSSSYSSEESGARQRIDISVVLSGADLNASIHRPERCMPAQGHSIEKSVEQTLATPKNHKLPVTELFSSQRLHMKSGEELSLKCITLYFFVGKHAVTRSHTERTVLDMKDRIFYGRNQRWAYVSVSSWYSDSAENPFRLASYEESLNKLREFVGDFADGSIDWSQIK